jgi:hypothetical protein
MLNMATQKLVNRIAIVQFARLPTKLEKSMPQTGSRSSRRLIQQTSSFNKLIDPKAIALDIGQVRKETLITLLGLGKDSLPTKFFNALSCLPSIRIRVALCKGATYFVDGINPKVHGVPNTIS